MFKSLLLLFLLIFLYSCGGNTTIKKETICKRDSSIVCSKNNAPILEKMDSKAISTNVRMFGASYKDKNMVKYMKTDVSKIDQCISVYQYYNCKAYCESDSITNEEKIKKDQEIVESCGALIKQNNKNKLESQKTISNTNENRIFIDFILEDGAKLDKKLKNIIYLAFEEKATEHTKRKYVIIDDKTKVRAMNRIIKERAWKQNDPRFLPELRKQLDADVAVEIVINPLGPKLLLTNKLVLLKESTIVLTKSLKYVPEENTKSNIRNDDFDDFDTPKVESKLKAEKIYDSFSKLASDFLKSLDNKLGNE